MLSIVFRSFCVGLDYSGDDIFPIGANYTDGVSFSLILDQREKLISVGRLFDNLATLMHGSCFNNLFDYFHF